VPSGGQQAAAAGKQGEALRGSDSLTLRSKVIETVELSACEQHSMTLVIVVGTVHDAVVQKGNCSSRYKPSTSDRTVHSLSKVTHTVLCDFAWGSH